MHETMNVKYIECVGVLFVCNKIDTLACSLLLSKRLRWSRGSVLAFGIQVRGFAPDRSRRIFRAKKNPQHTFLRRGSKAIGPMS